MENVILTIHLILALLLIGVVLLQRSEGGGLLGGGGGVMSGRQAANALTRLTWIFAAAFIATSVALTVVGAKKAASDSVIDRPGATGAPAEAPLTPVAPTGDLLPPSSGGDAPLVPPPAN